MANSIGGHGGSMVMTGPERKMISSASAPEIGSEWTRDVVKQTGFLRTKFQVGYAKSDRINFSSAQKVFHSGDVPSNVSQAKKAVNKKKIPNILNTEPHVWDACTIADPRVQKEVTKNLKRQLLKVRAGLMDEITLSQPKLHSDEVIMENKRYICAVTGQGPIGKLTGKWFNAIDERGLAKHCIEEKWNDWDQSHSCHTYSDQKQAQKVFAMKEERRKRMNTSEKKVNKESYVEPATSIQNLNDRLRERKINYQDLKEQFKKELKVEFPNASEERLQAMAQRLLNEKLLADEKTARFPVQHESFRPNLSLTTQDRRYKEYNHPGTWQFNEVEKRFAWSCCLAFDQNSKGCEFKVCNPDAWCTLGYDGGK